MNKQLWKIFFWKRRILLGKASPEKLQNFTQFLFSPIPFCWSCPNLQHASFIYYKALRSSTDLVLRNHSLLLFLSLVLCHQFLAPIIVMTTSIEDSHQRRVLFSVQPVYRIAIYVIYPSTPPFSLIKIL